MCHYSSTVVKLTGVVMLPKLFLKLMSTLYHIRDTAMLPVK